MSTNTTVIVGGVAGGMSTAARLRRRDEDMNIIVLEASGHVSFANCGLPYHVSGVIPERSSLLLQTPESLAARFNLDVRVNTRATAIDREQRTVTTDTGDTISYDHLVLSPGATPIIPPIPGIERALHLRTIEDVDAIIAALDDSVSSVAIIGGGFIGLEVAENMRHRGLDVTVIERAPQILTPLDEEMAAIVEKRLVDNGVTVITDGDTVSIGADSLELADARAIPADLVIASIGVRPANDLAVAAGLEVGARGGIKVDDQQRTSDPAIFADAIAGLRAMDGGARIDTIVLACTHFPLVQDELAAAAGPGVQFVDGNAGIARRIAFLTQGQPFERKTPDLAIFTGEEQGFAGLESALARYGIEQIEPF